ncbi:MAG: hypothetical protein RLZZ292_626 [Bacteroidota bacterium]|jgi:hypothetical protein
MKSLLFSIFYCTFFLNSLFAQQDKIGLRLALYSNNDFYDYDEFVVGSSHLSKSYYFDADVWIEVSASYLKRYKNHSIKAEINYQKTPYSINEFSRGSNNHVIWKASHIDIPIGVKVHFEKLYTFIGIGTTFNFFNPVNEVQSSSLTPIEIRTLTNFSETIKSAHRRVNFFIDANTGVDFAHFSLELGGRLGLLPKIKIFDFQETTFHPYAIRSQLYFGVVFPIAIK